MMSLAQFHVDNPNMAQALRILNKMAPETQFTYLTYRDWVQGTRQITTNNAIILTMKGVRP